MSALDWVIVGFTVLLACYGYVQGFIVGALSLVVPEGLNPQDLGSILDTSFEIAVRPGLHCAPYIHRALGTFPDGTLRLSPGPFNTAEDINAFLAALEAITAGVL